MRLSSFVVLLGMTAASLTGCSKDKEQCQQVALAVIDADNAYHDLKNAAGHGDRAAFEKARKALEAATAKLSAIEVTGSSLEAESTQATKKNYAAGVAKVVPAYEKLLEAVEKTPDLGKKYSGGVAPLSAVPEGKSVADDDSELSAEGSSIRSRKCQ